MLLVNFGGRASVFDYLEGHFVHGGGAFEETANVKQEQSAGSVRTCNSSC
jgi:hypothetical protein